MTMAARLSYSPLGTTACDAHTVTPFTMGEWTV